MSKIALKTLGDSCLEFKVLGGFNGYQLMKTNSLSLRTVFSALVLCACSVIPGLGCGDKDAAQSPPASNGSTGGALPNRSVAPPVITIDLDAITTRLGSEFQIQADSIQLMASGKTLNAQQSTAYFQAQKNAALTCQELSDALQKNPRWLASTSKSLEKCTKKAIIARTQAEKALAKSKKAGSAGSTTGQCPADISKVLNDKQLIIARILGMLSYSKAEMETPVAVGESVTKPPVGKTDSK